MKYLGVDYGLRKVGLAVSEGLIASPYKNLSIGSLEDALSQIQTIIRKEQISEVIVGLPESGPNKVITNKFIQRLRGFMTVYTVNEHLSTQMASQLMIEMGTSQKKRRHDDAMSAALILQSYLDNLLSVAKTVQSH